MPSWKEMRRYLDTKDNGWEFWKRSTHHDHYRKVLSNGELVHTRVSRGTGDIPKPLWKRILSQQLHITQEDFNRDK